MSVEQTAHSFMKVKPLYITYILLNELLLYLSLTVSKKKKKKEIWDFSLFVPFSPKISLIFGWKQSVCLIIHVPFFLFFSAFLFDPLLILMSSCIPPVPSMLSYHSYTRLLFLLLLPLYFLVFCTMFCIFFFFFCLSYSFFPTPPANSFSLFIYPIFSSSLSLRSQWVWLRGECGVPPLSLAIKAMPTPRLHMSSRPSKRGGVLLIRSVSHNANTPRQLSICRCMFWLHACCFVCLLSLCHWQNMSIIPSLWLLLKTYLRKITSLSTGA